MFNQGKRKSLSGAALLQGAVWLLGLTAFAAAAFNSYIGYDESYTLSLIRHSWAGIVRITGADVHPPLYYFIVKLLTMPFGYAEAAVKAVNLLPLLGMYVLGETVIRRRWGRPSALWFSFLAAFLPANLTYLLPELRMYGLASLLVTVCFIMSSLIAERRYDIVPKKAAWALFFSSGLGAAYTQYYALIAVVFLYLALALRLWRNPEKQKAGPWKGWLLCAGLSAVCYLPWLSVLVGQFRSVSGDYWIPPLSLRNYLSFIMFPFYSSMPAAAGLLPALASAAFAVPAVFWLIKKRRDNGNAALLWAAGAAVFAYVGMILAGVAVSLAVRPVFSVRYVKCVLGLLVFVLACLFARLCRRKQMLLAALFGLFAAANLAVICGKNAANREQYALLTDYVREHMGPEAAVLYPEDGHYMGVFSYWLRDYVNVLQDRYYKDEYMAYEPALMTESSYEARYGSLAQAQVWTVDIGNIAWQKEMDAGAYEVLERSPDFVFHDATDTLTCVLTRIRFTDRRDGD